MIPVSGVLIIVVGSAAALGLTMLTHRPHPTDALMFKRASQSAAELGTTRSEPKTSPGALAQAA